MTKFNLTVSVSVSNDSQYSSSKGYLYSESFNCFHVPAKIVFTLLTWIFQVNGGLRDAVKIKRPDIHALFQKLWTRAVGTADYDKQLWIELENKLITLIEEAETPKPIGSDWTATVGPDGVGMGTNNSVIYNRLVDHVEGLIRGEASTLIQGRADVVARIIVSQLAHVHGLRPPGYPDGGGPARPLPARLNHDSGRYSQRSDHRRGGP